MPEHDEYDDWGVPVGAYQDPDNLLAQLWSLARAYVLYRVKPAVAGHYRSLSRRNWSPRRLFTLVNALVVVWWVALYWGERGVFDGAVGACEWEGWEDWEAGANPHRLIFIADPQLVDPHTYPGRPWPLNPLTIKYTDLYMRRVYSRLQTALYPDTVLFLGDLFDGGREWSTRTTHSPEKEYRQYGDDYWLNEYNRFGNIFLNHWADGGTRPRPGQPGRKIISSLPGNHDLGFARGVQVGVRNRFNAFFGEGNRIDMIANHTFVSIDSVSLSALGQDSPGQVQDLWLPTKTFLDSAKTQKHRLVQRELRTQQGLKPYPLFPHTVIPAENLSQATLPHSTAPVQDFPTILLTHVPLYRAPGTPCGPLRERSPPSPGNPDPDEPNAIAVRGGYQYQNVLNREITAEIAEKIGDIRYAFSGDDHDYCEVVHRGYASAGGGIKEITVKSVSWAMGVRLPGVVLASLWNPVDKEGKPLSGHAEKTLQTKLCLLPDQIGTFIRYGLLFGVTLLVLVLRAVMITLGVLSAPCTRTIPTTSFTKSAKQTDDPLLPTAKHPYDDTEDVHAHTHTHTHHHPSSSLNSSTFSTPHTHNLQSRTPRIVGTATRLPTSYNPSPSHPLHQNQHQQPYPTYSPRDMSTASTASTKGKKSRKKGLALFMHELKSTLGTVCLCGFAFYFFLVWRG